MILLDTKTVMKLTGLAAMTLSHWIKKGWIKPVREGSKGRGLSYGFTGQQALLLCIAAAVRQTYGHASRYVRDNHALAMTLSDDDFREWIVGDLDPYGEERNAADCARDGIQPLLPEGALRDAVYPMLGRLREVCLELYGITPSGRTTAQRQRSTK